ncbi:ROK family transcriptional regulator [Evansella tamaricis]|uniref:ROK family transcriptional regulator n=1 Tax=Evansella tamaricis TaxID=2069301 RepID=A0ABS6JKJ7_9BACI|nr:ROK family transcriptional regulator [Evansella tamaricis]MBU9712838.1 ROK family transcriptional regulator [Evansella tamaricis]
MSSVAGSFKLMKSLNRTLVLNSIRINGAIPRSEIAKETKLTAATVTNIVNELISEELVLETKPGISSGGRKPILLTINSKSRYVFGIDVGVNKIRFAIADLEAKIVVKETEKIFHPLNNEDFLELLTSKLQIMFKNFGEKKSKIVGIGIAMHGIVDNKNGVALLAPTLKLKNIPIKTVLEKEFGIPVRIENDAKTLALGEEWYGHGQSVKDLVCLNIGEGIGAGIILNHKLFHGNDNSAGEIGHTIIDINGPKCSCGNYGCFQSLASGHALKESALREISLGRTTLLREKCHDKLENIDGLLIYQCALKGDSLSVELLQKTGRYIGIGIVNIIHFLNPPLIIIGGGVSRAKEFILPSIYEVIDAKSITPNNTQVVVSKLGEDGSLIGAFTLVLSELFNSINSSLS